jgi:hypothetical protein
MGKTKARTEAEIKAQADFLFGMTPAVDLKSFLEHARGQFQYHAGQRINSIRYFFAAYAIFVVAYAGTFTKSENPYFVNVVLCAMALIISLGFWALDARNVQMVEVNERALIELEAIVSSRFQLEAFTMTEFWDAAAPEVIRYHKIVNGLFAIIALVSLFATGYELRKIVCGTWPSTAAAIWQCR